MTKKSQSAGPARHRYAKALAGGFTLIELLLVIAIIGILSTIVLTSLATARQKARDAQRISDIRQLRIALQLYYNSIGSYPSNLNLLAPTYINTVPIDPLSPNDNDVAPFCQSAGYCYVVYPNIGLKTFYHLGAVLELNNPVLAVGSKANCKDFGGSPVASTCLPGGTSAGYFDGRNSTNPLTFDVVVP